MAKGQRNEANPIAPDGFLISGTFLLVALTLKYCTGNGARVPWPHQVAILGLAITPVARAAAAAATLRVTSTWQTGFIARFTITNSSPNLNLSGLAVSVDGAYASNFTVKTTGMLTTLPGGASTTFTVDNMDRQRWRFKFCKNCLQLT